MKKIIALVLMTCFCLTMVVGCGNSAPQEATEAEKETSAPVATEAATETPTEATTEAKGSADVEDFLMYTELPLQATLESLNYAVEDFSDNERYAKDMAGIKMHFMSLAETLATDDISIPSDEDFAQIILEINENGGNIIQNPEALINDVLPELRASLTNSEYLDQELKERFESEGYQNLVTGYCNAIELAFK